MMSAATDSQWIGLRLEALDTLFFRDGRSFDAAARVESGLPNPQTLAGALRTALLAREGFDLRGLREARPPGPEGIKRMLADCGLGWIGEARFRGPWLAIVPPDGVTPEPLLPTPQTLFREKRSPDADAKWYRAEPREAGLPGWRGLEAGMLPLWLDGMPDNAEPAGGFLTLAGLRGFLDGRRPDAGTSWFPRGKLFDSDSRVGIVVDAETLTAVEGMIYAINLLALNPTLESQDKTKTYRVCLCAEWLPGPKGPVDIRDRLNGPVPFGGEGRYVQVTPLSEGIKWPRNSGRAGRSMWYLATPGIFGGTNGASGWRPDGIPPGRLRAAASAAGVGVSGWDLNRGGPRPTRFAVPAGAVYYVEGEVEPPDGSLCGDAEDVAQGWGFALQGVWKS